MAEKLGMGDLAQSNGFGKQTPKRKGKAMLKGEHLCLSDLLDQDLSAYEYFQTLPPAVQTALRREDGGIGTLDELQARVAHLQDSHLIG